MSVFPLSSEVRADTKYTGRKRKPRFWLWRLELCGICVTHLPLEGETKRREELWKWAAFRTVYLQERHGRCPVQNTRLESTHLNDICHACWSWILYSFKNRSIKRAFYPALMFFPPSYVTVSLIVTCICDSTSCSLQFSRLFIQLSLPVMHSFCFIYVVFNWTVWRSSSLRHTICRILSKYWLLLSEVV